ncbi:MAG: hypothetical protein JWL81_2252 [Verrucomicrobiales bacterium]|nr:hypothetical protein [Verrucomicrobiales bacterium]
MKKVPVFISVFLALAAIFSSLYLSSKTRQPDPGRIFTAAQLAPAWKPEVLDVMERVPKTDDGRTKSLHTFAYYELLRNRAIPSVTLKLDDGSKRSLPPVAWILDAFLFPASANRYPIFNVEDSEALLQVGLNPHDKRRDKYAYDELLPAREQFFAARTRIAEIPAEKRDRLENQVFNLASNLIRYEDLIRFLDFARNGVLIPADFADEPLKSKAGKTVPLSEALSGLKDSPTFKSFIAAARAGDRSSPPELFQKIDRILQDTTSIAWYAPPDAANPDAWVPAAGLIRDFLTEGPHAATAIAKLQGLEKLADLAADPAKNAELQSAVQSLGQGLISAAEATGSYKKVALDRGYLKAGLFDWAKWGFLILFLVQAVSWLAPQSGWGRLLHKVCLWGAAAGYGAIMAGILWRVRITGWGPITNIYETIPFITLMAGVFAVFMELIFKNRIPLIVAICCGAAGMFLAGRYEAGNAADTMPSLMAVLRSNYWLWTHVTSINIGYATVLLAAIFSMIYIFCRLFDITRQDKALFRMLTQSSYGILCFGLVFSLIGTILGGIWGNDSWGRFWGWDPKENGAMVIVLWCLAVLHMRLAGWIKEIGLHICTAFGANFCLFSWWHVNLLNVGLHSYGFTQGLDQKLFISYGIVSLVVLLGCVIKFLEHLAMQQKGGEPPMAPVPGNAPVSPAA